jgi:predicted nucleic acid-binding protein
MLLELDIDWLFGSDTHQVERSTALANHLEIGGILGVVESAKLSIFNAETVLPEM